MSSTMLGVSIPVCHFQQPMAIQQLYGELYVFTVHIATLKNMYHAINKVFCTLELM